MLEGLGFDRLCQELYGLLLAEPSWDLGQLVRASGRSEAEVRSALDRLAELDLLRPSWDRAGAMRPVKPSVGVQVILARRQAEIHRQLQELAEAQVELTAFSDHYGEQNDGAASIETLSGMDAVNAQIEELAATARQECLSIVPGRAQTSEVLAAAGPLDEDALGRGVRVKTLFLDGIRDHAPTLRYARRLIGLGGEVRTSPALPMQMLIVDRSTALVPVQADDPRSGALVVRANGLLAALVALFEQCWSGATSLQADPQLDPATAPTRQERELLRTLAFGYTDDGAAQRLGVSTRTVRRLMAGLMERLDARSRFEAGIKVAERGWLSSDDGRHRSGPPPDAVAG